jgi:hypothetical protein
MAVLILL